MVVVAAAAGRGTAGARPFSERAVVADAGSFAALLGFADAARLVFDHVVAGAREEVDAVAVRFLADTAVQVAVADTKARQTGVVFGDADQVVASVVFAGLMVAVAVSARPAPTANPRAEPFA